jgi:hypothetical protein
VPLEEAIATIVTALAASAPSRPAAG